MLRPRRFPRRTALVIAILAVLLGIPRVGHPATRPGAAKQPVAAITLAMRSPAAPAVPFAPAVPGTAAAAAAPVAPAVPGGLCSVPGIGDIGGVLGFCSLGTSGLTGDLNNICQPALPSPEPASGGIDSLVKPAASAGPQTGTLYDTYGVAGDYWAATSLQCSDMSSLIGNNVSSMIFDIAKSIDRVTISIYQSAAGNGILTWLTSVVDKLISSLGNAIYFPYLAIVVLLGAIWLAWQGLIRKRGTRTIEGTVWMVVACAAAIWLIGRPGDFTGLGKSVSNGISQTLNVAFSKLPSPGQSNCIPVQHTDPQVQPVTYSYSAGNGIVDQNANELWTVLVCKPWLDGEFGTTTFATSAGGQQTAVNRYARQLLWAQAIAVNERPTIALIQAKQATYAGIASSIKQADPGIYPLFQGKEWTTRLEIGFAALFAAVVAGVLVLLIAVTLILLKLGFLLLLVVGPFFLLIGTHPGYGRVIALRWFEMLVGVLLKQAAVALVLSILLYSYSLIMGTSDAVLPWALKILMIALVTVAVFIYRRPFQHLFSAVGYGMIGSTDRAEADLGRAGTTARRNTLGIAAAAVPGYAAYRTAKWARRNPDQADGLAIAAGSITGRGPALAPGMAGTDDTAGFDVPDGYVTAEASGAVGGSAVAGGGRAEGTRTGGRAGLSARARARAAAAGEAEGRTAPPLNLPSRQSAGSVPASWSRSGEGPVPATGADPAGAGHAQQVQPTGNGSSGRSAAPGSGGMGRAGIPAVGGRPALAGGLAPPPSAPSHRTQSHPAQAHPAQSHPASPAPPQLPGSRPADSGQPRRAGPTSAWPGGAGWHPQAGPPSGPAGVSGGPGRPPAQPQSGHWADTAAGRSAPPPPARPSAPPPSRAASAPPARPSGPPARPSAPPARPSGPPARPSGPPARAASAPPARAASAPSGWPATPPPAQPANGGPAGRPSAPPARHADTSTGRAPAAAPQGRHSARHPQPVPWSGSTAEAQGMPPAGRAEADPAESPVPFWLRPLRRRK